MKVHICLSSPYENPNGYKTKVIEIEVSKLKILDVELNDHRKEKQERVYSKGTYSLPFIRHTVNNKLAVIRKHNQFSKSTTVKATRVEIDQIQQKSTLKKMFNSISHIALS